MLGEERREFGHLAKPPLDSSPIYYWTSALYKVYRTIVLQ